LSPVEFSQRFDDGRAVDANSAAPLALVHIPVTVRQLLNIAVEIQSNQLSIAIDDGATGVSPDRVGRIDKVKRRVQVEFRLSFPVPFRQIKGRLFIKAPRAVV